MNCNKYYITILSIVVLLLFSGCATTGLQFKGEQFSAANNQDKKLVHRFYLVGDAGELTEGAEKVLANLKQSLSKDRDNTTVLFLGDNIYPKGYPDKKAKDREHAEKALNNQINAVKDFSGRVIFIPGNHDWYNGLKGLKRQEDHIEKALGKNSFLPENGCPIEKVNISKEVVMIIVDSHWYLTNWDNHPTMNDDCEIKTRDKFLEELESEIKKARGKTTIVAIHHPLFSNGPHGGQFSFMSNLTPIPVLGTLKDLVRKTGGVINVDIQNARYTELRKHLVTIAQENSGIIFVSGHEHNLQYLVEDNLPQIVSGSGSKNTPVRNVGGGKFAYSSNGYAVLDVFEDGSSNVSFYSAKENRAVYQTPVYSTEEGVKLNYPNSFPESMDASIYTEEETTKGKAFRFFWGDRYRKYYSTKIKASTVSLDTLFGGVKPVRKGGGHQSKSLRLRDKDGREYVMRALRKESIQFIQTSFFTDQYIEGQFENTYTNDLIVDVFTGAHPYAPFVVGTLSDAVGIYHTNPKIYYVPKQNALGDFNKDFGDELYMVEEHPSDGHEDQASFGFSDKLISSDDMLKKLRKDEDYILDEPSYIRARLFDMLIGDWDRHSDQWRWATFKEKDKTVFRPVPRDRDQAFALMADGWLFNLGTKLIPAAKVMRSYDESLENLRVKDPIFCMDVALITQSEKDIWEEQAKIIQSGITNEVIDQALSFFPKEVQDETLDDIKRKLVARRDSLQIAVNNYYKQLYKYAIIVGTDKDDWFDIERLPEGKTKVTGYRIKKGNKADIIHQRTYSHLETKEIWLYMLDDKDVVKVYGHGDHLIKVRIVGGQNNDTYNMENSKRIKVYDYKTKSNTFEGNTVSKKLTNDYETNVYNYKKPKSNTNQFLPSMGYNPDDGVKLGLANTNTIYGFERNPYTTRHAFTAGYYFATNGFDLDYSGDYANAVGKANFNLNLHFNSPNFSVNYFGFGNETINPNAQQDEVFEEDYNRVKIRSLKVKPALVWKGDYGGALKTTVFYEANKVERTLGRYIATLPEGEINLSRQEFVGAEVQYQFKNQDYKSFPTLGMLFSLQLGVVDNIGNSNTYSYFIPQLGFDYKLVYSGDLVLSTLLSSQMNFGDGYEFYQAASIGANNGLRGFRNQRFIGKQSFLQSSDLRWNVNRLKNGILPMRYGIYGGFDYGRVWLEEDMSEKWHTSFGGGIFVEVVKSVSGNISLFNSADGTRFAFKLGFGF